MELEKHGIPAAYDIWYGISSTKSYEDSVIGRTTIINRKIVLNNVALVPESETPLACVVFIHLVLDVDLVAVSLTNGK